MKSRTFQHYETGRTIICELNIPTSQIPEYRLPYGPEDREQLARIVAYCVASWGPTDAA